MLQINYRSETVVVRVNDRGPFVAGHWLDLSATAARRLHWTGMQSVCMERCVDFCAAPVSAARDRRIGEDDGKG